MRAEVGRCKIRADAAGSSQSLSNQPQVFRILDDQLAQLSLAQAEVSSVAYSKLCRLHKIVVAIRVRHWRLWSRAVELEEFVSEQTYNDNRRSAQQYFESSLRQGVIKSG